MAFLHTTIFCGKHCDECECKDDAEAVLHAVDVLAMTWMGL